MQKKMYIYCKKKLDTKVKRLFYGVVRILFFSTSLFFHFSSLVYANSTEKLMTLQHQSEEDTREESKKSSFTQFWEKYIEIGGWVEAVQSVRTSSPHDAVTSRLRGRLEFSADFGSLYAFVSADAEKNWTIPDEDGFSFHEAWVEYLGKNWDLRLGRQVIIWGNSDGVRITDNISPTDFTEYLNRGIDEMRMPVTAGKLRLLRDNFITEFIWIPEFRASKLATGDNPWAIDYSSQISALGLSVIWNKANEPTDFSIKDSELAVRFSSYLVGFDVSLSVFYTWDDMVSNFYSLQNVISGGVAHTALSISPEHTRLMIYGLDFAKPWSNFVFRGETAYFQGRYFATQNGQATKHDMVKALLGVDWTPGNNWTITAQIYDDWIVDYNKNILYEEHIPQATLSFSKTFFNELLTLSDTIYYSFNDGEFFNRLQAKYELAEGVELSLGWDMFHGDDGLYGVYKDNSQVWGKIRYSF